MSNHWHILVEVPRVQELDDAELHRRILAFYSPQRGRAILQEYERVLAYAQESGNNVELEKWRAKYTVRMGNLSAFMKELKERFTKWYNRRNDRTGTLWEERFKSVLVENSDHVISTMAAYIELNPVRAGLVDDPKDYRFCGYAEAVAGGAAARDGIAGILRMEGQADEWKVLATRYRVYLFSTGEETESRAGLKTERVKEVLEAGGTLSAYELMRCHVRYFNDGVALGSRLFIEEVFEQHRSLFGERRKTGARKVRGCEFFNLRDLKKNAIGPPE
jgi:hypothetical protein